MEEPSDKTLQLPPRLPAAATTQSEIWELSHDIGGSRNGSWPAIQRKTPGQAKPPSNTAPFGDEMVKKDKFAASWEWWETTWEAQERHLQQRVGRPVDSLAMNSMHQHKERILFQDLLEESQPQQLSDSLEFAVSCRNAGVYYTPLGGLPSRPYDMVTHWMPTTVRKAPDGNIVSAAKHRRSSMPARERSPARRPERREVYSPEPARASALERFRPTSDQLLGPVLHGTPDLVKTALGSERRHTLVEGKIRPLKPGPRPGEDKDSAALLQQAGGLVLQVAHQRTQQGEEENADTPLAPEMSPPAPLKPLHLSATRLSFTSAPGKRDIHTIYVTNNASVALRVTATPVARPSLPSAALLSAADLGDPEAEEKTGLAAGNGKSREPTPFSGIVLTDYLLPGKTAEFPVVFETVIAGSYTGGLSFSTAPSAGLSPITVSLWGRCIMPAAAGNHAIRWLAESLEERETSGFVRELLLRSVFGPAVAQAARHSAGSDSLYGSNELLEKEESDLVASQLSQQPQQPPVRQKGKRLQKTQAAPDGVDMGASGQEPQKCEQQLAFARENAELPVTFTKELFSSLERFAEAVGLREWNGSIEALEAAAAVAEPSTERARLLEELDALLSADSLKREAGTWGCKTLIREAVSTALDNLQDELVVRQVPFAIATTSRLTFRGAPLKWSWEDLRYETEPEKEGGPRMVLERLNPLHETPTLTPPDDGNKKATAPKQAQKKGAKVEGKASPDPQVLCLLLASTQEGAGSRFRSVLLQLADSVADLYMDASS